MLVSGDFRSNELYADNATLIIHHVTNAMISYTGMNQIVSRVSVCNDDEASVKPQEPVHYVRESIIQKFNSNKSLTTNQNIAYIYD